ncbi:MAG: TIGR02270 family protein [Hyalangium sp.]|uniref:TIGR02270 family protein n=1 Tax=Hyalangium sp. TaxID=2028555 RepID=UPI003899C831
MKSPRRQPLAWDILQEHLQEAAFLWKQRWRSLLASDYVLSEIAEGDEARLLAHIDGLVIGGRPAAERILLPALEGEETPSIVAAACALLESKEPDWLPTVLDWFVQGADEVRAGISQALSLSGRADVTSSLVKRFSSLDAADQVFALEVLRSRQADTGQVLTQLAAEREGPELLIAAIRAARFAPSATADVLIRQGLEDPEPRVRDAAIETGLVHGSRMAWARCRQLLEAGEPEARPALLAFALGGEQAELEALSSAVGDPARRTEALWALGFSGRLSAAEAALAALRDAGDRVALESFALITGLPIASVLEEEDEDEDEWAEDEEDDESSEEEEAEGSEEDSAMAALPGPEELPGKVRVAAVEAWWKKARASFEPNGRYLLGRPVKPESLPALMEEVPMRRRPVFGWELAIRSRGACRLEPLAWTFTQRKQLVAARELRPESLTRAFSRLFSA